MPYILLLISIECILFFTNYIAGTYLIGWDVVMPEFNLWLNFKRALFAVWQDYRGLGLLDGMAHSANLMHTIYISLLSLLLPQSLLRYTFLHLTHLLGGIGFFLLAGSLLKNRKAALAGSLFYMFNLGIIQMYYAPLEVFAVHFAALPWLFLIIDKTLINPTKKNLFLLIIASFLTSPQAFVPTVFIAFFVLFTGHCLVYSITARNVKHVLIVLLFLLAANSFWLLPYAYSVYKNAPIILNTKINQFSSEEIFYRNKAHGDIKSVLSLTGFMLDSIEYDSQRRKDIFFMDQWRAYLQQPFYRFSFAVVALFSGVGLCTLLWKRERRYYPYVFTFGVAFFFLANNTPLLDKLNLLLRTAMPLAGEAFRFPFTKFITIFALCYCLFFAYGFRICMQKARRLSPVVFFLTFLTLFILSYPAFRGYFFSPLLKLHLPQEYVDATAYLKEKNENGKIALLPAYTFWNWQYRNWGYRGSDFLWYGIPQPLLLRAFDPWSTLNEQFYNELSYAITIQDQKLFAAVLQKYDIAYLLLDTTIQNAITKQQINYDSLVNFLERSTVIKDKKVFSKITVYRTNIQVTPLYRLDKNGTPVMYPNFSFAKEDVFFKDYGNYIVDQDTSDASYLLPSLSTEKLQSDLEFSVKDHQDRITFVPKKQYLLQGNDYVLEIPSYFANEFLIPIQVNINAGKIFLTPLYPTVTINGEHVVVADDPIVLEPKIVKNPTSILFADTHHEILANNTNAKTYLLNTYINVIKVRDGKKEELLFVDTSAVHQASFTIPLAVDHIDSIEIAMQKTSGPYNMINIIQNNLYQTTEETLHLHPFRENSHTTVSKENTAVVLEATSGTLQLTFHNDDLPHLASYLLLAKTQYSAGLPIQFYVDNPLEQRPEAETRFTKTEKINIVVIPKTEEYYKGYGFHFIVKSVGTEFAKSVIEEINLYPFPAETIKRIRLVKQSAKLEKSTKNGLSFTKYNPSLYTTILPQEGYLVLSQAYHDGWKAYAVKSSESGVMTWITTIFPFFFGSELKDHVLVNNWENGWKLENNPAMKQSSNETIVIVFLPQYLEYIGFALFLACIGWVTLTKKKTA